MATGRATRWLVLAVGNPLRRDDGLGRWVAERLAGENLPYVNVLSDFQLLPEMSAALAEADAALFVDACPATASASAEGGAHANAWGHRFAIADLCDLARTAFGAAPTVRELRVPGGDFGFGEGFSDAGRAAAEAALAGAREILTRETACTKSA